MTRISQRTSRKTKKAKRQRSHPRFPNQRSQTSHKMLRLIPLALIACLGCAGGTRIAAQSNPETKPAKVDRDYLVYVLSESADRIALVRFGPGGARVDHDLHTGEMPTDINGPHGIAISADKRFYYVSLAHGRPFGTVWKYAVEGDRVLGETTLGLFPATMDITKDGGLLFIVNFNLHGDMVPSSV